MSEKSKFTSAPSIAKYDVHEKWITQMLEQLPKLDPELAPVMEEATNDMIVKDVPLKLQTHANIYSLKRTKEQRDLQAKIDAMPRSVMAGSPEETNLLCMLLEIMNAKTVVEIGVFRGLSTLAFALCLQGLNAKHGVCGRKVIGLDVSEDFAEVGKEAWKAAGVQDMIDFRVGDAKQSLSDLLEQDAYGPASVDLCFIDADKTSYGDYYEKCVNLTKSGGLIVVDNTLWMGQVAVPNKVLEAIASSKKAKDDEKGVLAKAASYAMDALEIKRVTETIANDDRIERVSFLTIADGVTICRKK